MPCTTIEQPDGPPLHINFADPNKVVHHENLGERWCFRCRKRREFLYLVTADVEPSYYGPNPSVRCAECNLVDGDLFPGREREWE